MMGVWEVRIEHRKSWRSKAGRATGFLMNDEDAKTMLKPAFEKAVNLIKKSIEKEGK